MHGKILKGLSGLGGAAALTTGGVFLKNHLDKVSERKRQEEEKMVRFNFLKKHDEKIKKLKETNSGIYFPGSDEPDEFWEWLWIMEAGSGKWEENKWTKEDMEEREKNFWETTNRMHKKHRDEINSKYPSDPYWKKYRELCFLWNSNRDDGDINPSGALNLCFTDHSWEIYKTKDWYKGYEKFKESNKEMGIGEYFWTIWMKFTKKCDSEIGSKNKDSSQILQLFDDWRRDSNTCQIQ